MAVIPSTSIQFGLGNETTTNTGTIVMPINLSSSLVIDRRAGINSQVLFIPRCALENNAGSVYPRPYVAVGGCTAGSYTMTLFPQSGSALLYTTVVFN